MGLLDHKVFYAKTWQAIGEDKFSDEEINQIESIEIVAGNYGISAKVETTEGNTFYPIQRDSSPLKVGDKLDPQYCYIITLKRGDATTEKLRYNAEPLQ